jgi:hypothetical protein
MADLPLGSEHFCFQLLDAKYNYDFDLYFHKLPTTPCRSPVLVYRNQKLPTYIKVSNLEWLSSGEKYVDM